MTRHAAADLTASLVRIRPDDRVDIKPYGGAWANVLRNGGYNRVHNHPGAVWSAVYYVATGEPFPEPHGNGNIEFMDPRPGNIHGGKQIFTPEEGQLLIFPAWRYHYVNPFYGKGERISIAWNMEARILR